MLSYTPRNRAPGRDVVANFPNEEVWHARLILEWIGGDVDHCDSCVALTPDGDLVVDDYGSQGGEVAGVMSRPEDRGAPLGVNPELVYDFSEFPNTEDMDSLYNQALEVADSQRAIRGWPPGSLPLAPLRPAPGMTGSYGIQARRGNGATPARPLLPAGPAGGAPAPRPPPANSGLAALSEAVHNEAGDRSEGPMPKRPRPCLPLQQEAGQTAGSTGQSGLDALSQAITGKTIKANIDGEDRDMRVLGVMYGQQGQRFRSSADAIVILEEIASPDSPVKGPCTVLWVCRFIRENAGTPTQCHIRWTSLAKLQPTDGGVALHKVACRALEIAVCYDQLNVGALATIEYLARQLQTQEQRWRDRITGVTGDQQQEAQLLSGVAGRTPLCICPALQE